MNTSPVVPAGRPQSGYVDYPVCRTIQNLHTGTATITDVEVTILGPSGEVLVAESMFPYERAMGYLDGYSGCRGTVRDSNSAHPLGTRYRLRNAVKYDDGVTGTVEGEAAIDAR